MVNNMYIYIGSQHYLISSSMLVVPVTSLVYMYMFCSMQFQRNLYFLYFWFYLYYFLFSMLYSFCVGSKYFYAKYHICLLLVLCRLNGCNFTILAVRQLILALCIYFYPHAFRRKSGDYVYSRPSVRPCVCM